MYENTKWRDRIVDAETGALLQAGTILSAGKMNNLEDGITDAHIFAKLMAIINHNTESSKEELPTVTAEDEGKFLRVVGGVWAKCLIPNAEEASF